MVLQIGIYNNSININYRPDIDSKTYVLLLETDSSRLVLRSLLTSLRLDLLVGVKVRRERAVVFFGYQCSLISAVPCIK